MLQDRTIFIYFITRHVNEVYVQILVLDFIGKKNSEIIHVDGLKKE